jgi:hypothetical protein
LIAANNLGTKYVRETQLLSRWNGVKNYNIDFGKAIKKNVVANINNDSTPSHFPIDLVAYEANYVPSLTYTAPKYNSLQSKMRN